ncbi:MAG: MbnP family copper-binding protein [Cyanobacteria bacterium P01_D01_bin.36]
MLKNNLVKADYRQAIAKVAVSSVVLPAVALSWQLEAQAIDEPIESEMVTIEFAGMVGDEQFACGETYRLGTQDSAVTPLDFRLYVSEVALLDAEGNAVPLVLEQDGLWQYQNVALIDFEDKTGGCANGTSETRAQVVGSVPAGEYSGLQFTVGVPFALNHIDSTLAPSPLNLTSMWWNWNFGYKFARIDFQPVVETANLTLKGENSAVPELIAHGDDNAATPFAIHLGSVGCQMDSAQPPVNCTLPHRSEIVLNDFDPAENVVVADISALLADTDMSQNQEGTAVGCMSNPMDNDCSGILQNFGLSFREQPGGEQTLFSVE